MLKLSSPPIIKPFSIIFQNSLKSSIFPDDWKKRNIVTAHKKNNKQLVNNYRPVPLLHTCSKNFKKLIFDSIFHFMIRATTMVPLLHICSKIFEKLIFDSIFHFMIQNNLFNSCQSDFRANDSCVNQLISITHNKYRTFDANPSIEAQGVSLDLSKTFDKVWHESL